MSNIVNNALTEEFSDLIESFERDIINTISQSLNKVTDIYSDLEDKLIDYVNVMREDTSAKFTLSTKYVNVEEAVKLAKDTLNNKFSILSDKVKSLRDTYMGYVMTTNKDSVLKEALTESFTSIIAGLMGSYVCYIQNLEECFDRITLEINLFRQSSSEEDYNSRIVEYHKEITQTSEDLVIVDGELVIYVERTLEQLVSLLTDRGYKVLLLEDKYCIYFKGFNFTILPITVPTLKALQCNILKVVQV